MPPEMPPSADAGASAPEPESWTRLGQFEISRKIGQGGMGAVFLAQQVTLNRPVALKLLPPSLAENAAFIDRFQREARAAAGLSHPNLIQVYDAGSQHGVHYFAMEFVDGETLSTKVERDGPLHEHSAVAIAMCVAAALYHAWTRARLIHRDIKPENVMLTAEGVVKVCDLGLAKSAGGDSRLTVSGMMLGTPQYVAPEQARGDEAIDTRADIYSLGATLYHLVTGRPPFHADSAMAIMYKHVHEPMPDPRKFTPDLSDGFLRILQKMTAKDPADRYRDMLELYNDLERCHDGLTPAAVSLPAGRTGMIRTPMAADEAALRSLRRGLWFWRVGGGIGLIVIGLAIFGIWKSAQTKKQAPPPVVAKKETTAPHKTSAAAARAVVTPSASATTNTTPSVRPQPAATGAVTKQRAAALARMSDLLRQQQAEAERRAEELRKAEAETEKQRTEARARNTARLKAEEGYRSFLGVWQPLALARNHAQAEVAAQNALKDPSFAPLKEPLESHLAMSQRLKAFHAAFPSALQTLKGKPLTYEGLSGTVGAVDERTITIEKVAGVGRSFSLVALRTDQLLTLALAAMGQNHPDALVDAGLVALAENHADWAKQYFDKARLLDSSAAGAAKAAAQRFDTLRETMARAPAETTAAAALDELQGLLAMSKWEEASSKLAVVSKQFADTTTIQCSTERLQDAHDAIVAAEAGPTEARAQLALNKLRQDIEEKNWKHAAQMLQTLSQKFAGTDVVQSADELPALREIISAHLPASAALAEPAVRDRVASRKGATIHPVEGGGKGKLSQAALAAAVAAAKEGDGIELESGIHMCRAMRGTTKNLSIFGKPGVLPVLIVPSLGRSPDGILVDTAGARWRFENLMFVGGGRPSDAAAQTTPPITVAAGATIEFHQCLFTVPREAARPVSLVRATGAGGELIFRNCLFLNGSAVDIQQPRRVRLDRCTWVGGPVLWLSGTAQGTPVSEVALINSLVVNDAGRGFITSETSAPETRALAPAEVVRYLDLSRSHHNVLMLSQADGVEAWRQLLEKQSRGPNFLSLTTDSTPLAIWTDRQQAEFSLLPDCPAAHAADDGKTVGVRWPSAVWDSVKANFRIISTSRPAARPAAEAIPR